jgi:hypothetical protein
MFSFFIGAFIQNPEYELTDILVFRVSRFALIGQS